VVIFCVLGMLGSLDVPSGGAFMVAALDPRLATHHRLDAARAHLLERAGQYAEAISYYRQAAQRTSSTPERNYLLLHAARLSDSLAGARCAPTPEPF
jgi:predicted RNA polymerase sigma factor